MPLTKNPHRKKLLKLIDMIANYDDEDCDDYYGSDSYSDGEDCYGHD